MRAADPVECQIPATSTLRPDAVNAAYYWDAYRAPIASPPASVVDLFFAVFAHHPHWMKAAIRSRNRVVRAFGLKVPPESDDFDRPRLTAYTVGDLIGRWPIYTLNDDELVAGRDSSHLDFRVSVLREVHAGSPTVAISTVCVVHNWVGKVYLLFVLPFHRRGVRYIIARALRAGRL